MVRLKQTDHDHLPRSKRERPSAQRRRETAAASEDEAARHTEAVLDQQRAQSEDPNLSQVSIRCGSVAAAGMGYKHPEAHQDAEHDQVDGGEGRVMHCDYSDDPHASPASLQSTGQSYQLDDIHLPPQETQHRSKRPTWQERGKETDTRTREGNPTPSKDRKEAFANDERDEEPSLPNSVSALASPGIDVDQRDVTSNVGNLKKRNLGIRLDSQQCDDDQTVQQKKCKLVSVEEAKQNDRPPARHGTTGDEDGSSKKNDIDNIAPMQKMTNEASSTEHLDTVESNEEYEPVTQSSEPDQAKGEGDEKSGFHLASETRGPSAINQGFLDFDTLPGSPIEPLDIDLLSEEYEKLSNEYDQKFIDLFQQWQALNEKIERWISRGTEMQNVREQCLLRYKQTQVDDQVKQATKQREELVRFCRHMQKAFSNFFPDTL